MVQEIPMGSQDFKEIREKNLYFVDKTDFIADILKERMCRSYLYTRPRRFGKSMNLSMLDAFFNLKYKGNTWFDGLKINDHREYDEYKNAFPVICFDFKNIEFTTYASFRESFEINIRNTFSKYDYLKDSTKLNTYIRSRVNDFFDKDSELYLNDSLMILVRALRLYHGSKVILLLDEYDHPSNKAFGNGDYEQIIGFMNNLLTQVLKGNEDVTLGVVTGIMQMAQGSMFSGLNNLVIQNMFSPHMDGAFGFTEDEVRKICADFGNGNPEEDEQRLAVAKEWYDGYRIGKKDLYNPWDVLNYVYNGFEPGSYWADSGKNDIIDTLLERGITGVQHILRKLSQGEKVIMDIYPRITYSELLDYSDAIYSIMAMSGYLNVFVDKDRNKWVALPNKEVKDEFDKKILNKVGCSRSEIDTFTKSLMSGEVDTVTSSLNLIMKNMISKRILDNEHSYQAFLLGLLLNLPDTFEVKGDHWGGNGYYDIRIRNLGNNGMNVVIEIKLAKNEDEMHPLALKALEQIHEKWYFKELEGMTALYGVAFHGTRPKIICETGMCDKGTFVPIV